MRYLQLALRRAGQNIALDGIFGPKTCEAVKQVTGSSRSCVVEAAHMRSENGKRVNQEEMEFFVKPN